MSYRIETVMDNENNHNSWHSENRERFDELNFKFLLQFLKKQALFLLSLLYSQERDEKLHNGDSREVDGMGFIVPFEGRPVCYEVIVIFEKCESWREGK